MRIFLDTNVWASASIARGICAELVLLLLGRIESGTDLVLIAQPVRDEYLRIMNSKMGASERHLQEMREIFDVLERVEGARPALPVVIPDPDDVPIIAAALAGKADCFVTGDKVLLEFDRIEEMRVVSPRMIFKRLKGLHVDV